MNEILQFIITPIIIAILAGIPGILAWRSQRDKTDAEADRIESEKRKLEDEITAHVIERAKRELLQMDGRIVELEKECQETSVQLNNLQRAHETLQRQHDNLDREYKAVQRANETQRKRIRELELENKKLRERLTELEKKADTGPLDKQNITK